MPLADRELVAGHTIFRTLGSLGWGEDFKLPVLVPFKLPGCRAGPFSRHTITPNPTH
jgi:hypothetical protein